ncbi:hypothetical protein QBC34DRAFT_496868 [Podospora aff. communis PSN243]|uniref:Prolyl 4-hydroxylase alpha subunit Fe(2+) 2OG dioxygenase domain-containing protein n=1 Tax=Podospora aff. communis PSN243 TaxID=3040156 RepID=A0AAV9GDS3_9PEZI|nr:hypothetical protein QBC34DRAFT_496868 [Podospora aff. communis PSN243]
MDLSALLNEPVSSPTQQLMAEMAEARTAANAVTTDALGMSSNGDEAREEAEGEEDEDEDEEEKDSEEGEDKEEEDDANHDDETVTSDTASIAPSDLSTTDFSVDLKKDLRAALDSIRSRGSYAAFANLPDLRPELAVDDIGPISLPLSETQARQIIDKARQDSQSRLEQGRRCRHQVSANSLAINQPVTAELRGMVVYEKGPFFKAPEVSEEIPGMFGTMIIVLSSPHEGGDLIVKHHRSKKGFRTQRSQSSVACWYSDVSHEVCAITSGYRLVLKYNLAISPDLPRPSANLARSRTRGLRHTLRRYLEGHNPESDDNGEDVPGMLYYALDHDYTKASLSLKALKPRDHAVVHTLNDICAEVELKIFLAVVEKHETGEPIHNYPNRKLIDLSGRVVRSEIDIDGDTFLDELIQDWEDPWEDAKCGERNYSAGESTPHWYRRAAVIIVPRGDVSDEFVTRALGGREAENLLPHFVTQCLEEKRRPAAIKMICRLAQKAWSNNMYGSYGGPSVNVGIAAQVIDMASLIGDSALFGTVLGLVKSAVEPPVFRKARIRVNDPDDDYDFDKFKGSLLECLLSRPMADQLKFLQAMSPEDGEVGSPVIKDWIVNDVLPSCIKRCRDGHVGEDDGDILMSMILQQLHDLDFLKTRVIPLVAAKVNHYTPFSLAVLERILMSAFAGTFDLTETLDICKPVMKSIVALLDLSNLRTEAGLRQETEAANKARRIQYGHTPGFNLLQLTKILGPRRLAVFLEHCLRCGDELAMQLSFKIVAGIDKIPFTEFRPFWVPFVRFLVTSLENRNVPLGTPRYQQLACAILEAYVARCVGREPTGRVNNCQNPVLCSCKDCHHLNAFLMSHEQVWRFAVGNSRRQHLHQVLERAGANCTHVTSRHTNPNTLVVTKGLDPFSRAKQEWDRNIAAAMNDFAEFDQDKLKQLLGREFEHITGMQHLRHVPVFRQGAEAAVNPPSRVLAPVSANRGSENTGSRLPGIGVKRRADEH